MMECPACGEISFGEAHSYVEGKTRWTEYECWRCGCLQQFASRKKVDEERVRNALIEEGL